MRTPRHWAAPAGMLALVLAPLGWVYGRVTAWRMGLSGYLADIPVICVGNVTAGGAGKTPVALLAANILKGQGETPIILSRGYGGRLVGPVVVDGTQHSSADVGDEPLLLAQHHSVVASRNKVDGAVAAIKTGATVIVLDDGLQNPTVMKDLTIVVVDAAFGIGNGYCVPAGPLRAPLADQILHADVVLTLGDSGTGNSVEEIARAAGKPTFRARLVPYPQDIAALSGKPLMAFAGIGRPEKFFETLRQVGLDVKATVPFADHQMFTEQDRKLLSDQAQASGLTLVTTEKDAMRLPPGFAAVLRVTAKPEEPALLSTVVEAAVKKRRLVP
jgi:tetraacyldisaccharide 4'-kinase